MKSSFLSTVAFAGVLLVSVAPSAKQAALPGDGALVELDVSVTDKNGMVTDLRQEEFEVRDDGKQVMLKTFTAVSLGGSMARGDGCDLVLVLDDAGVPMAGTQAIQSLASYFTANARSGDNLSVVRLHTASDDMSKDRQVAASRIAAYKAGSIPFFTDETTEDMLRLVIKLSKQWEETTPRRRRAIVCIGSPAVCGPQEKESTAPRDEYPNWVNAVTAAARANVVVYAAIPSQVSLVGEMIIGRTGGDVFAGTASYRPAVERVYGDLSHYYMLGYTPTSSKKDLRSVSVRVNRRGVTVHTRSRRGK